jgi:hypothetical protein
MDTRYSWRRRLEAEELELSFADGFKFRYGRWITHATAQVAFLSLNPGVAPDGVDLRTVSDEGGNSYVIERETTRSPITDQDLRMAAFLGAVPSAILAGGVIPFRSARMADLSPQQRAAGLALAAEFWREPRALTFGHRGSRSGGERLRGRLPRGDARGRGSVRVGNQRLRRFRTPDGRAIVHLPHLSQFKLFSRGRCMEPLAAALRS